MKKGMLILMLLLTPLLYAYDYDYGQRYHGEYREGYHDGYRDARNRPAKARHVYVKVVRSVPIYEEVVTYRECRSTHRRDRAHTHEGALIGGLIGGIIGSRMDEEHRPGSAIGGAVAGAIIGSAIASSQHKRPRCKYVETRLNGYRNIAYWQGEKIVEISERPLRRIRVDLPRRHRRY